MFARAGAVILLVLCTTCGASTGGTPGSSGTSPSASTPAQRLVVGLDLGPVAWTADGDVVVQEPNRRTIPPSSKLAIIHVVDGRVVRELEAPPFSGCDSTSLRFAAPQVDGSILSTEVCDTESSTTSLPFVARIVRVSSAGTTIIVSDLSFDAGDFVSQRMGAWAY